MKKIFLLLLLPCIIFSCNQSPPTEEEFASEEQEEFLPDTLIPVITTSYSGKEYPVIFTAAFHDSTTVRQYDQLLEFEVKNIGRIKITSGKIIACDPFVRKHGKPFTQLFPVGEFPVELAVVKDSTGEYVAFCRIVFSEEQVAKWEYALLPGQDPIRINDTRVYCHGVDSATTMYIDEAANKVFMNEFEPEQENYMNARKKNRAGFIHSFMEFNFASIPSGYGNGCYPVFIGYDENGEVVYLLTDFSMVEWWKLPEAI